MEYLFKCIFVREQWDGAVSYEKRAFYPFKYIVETIQIIYAAWD